ncbi:MAG: response regulator [Phycisphaerae bacterium]|nr:response regulator [Phycisphaerae bacterium]
MDRLNLGRILLIDDDAGVLNAMKTRLEAAGYQCLVAHSGDEGLVQGSLGDLDLVITDLQMPGLGGLGVIRMIRSLSDVPVIVVTGYARQFREEAERCSGVTVLAKPFESEALLELVETELALRPTS